MSWQWFDMKPFPRTADRNMEPPNGDEEAQEPEADGPDPDDERDREYAYGDDWD